MKKNEKCLSLSIIPKHRIGIRFSENKCLDLICDVMGQNQSHVAKHETAQICILSENVKICPFLVSIKNEIFL